MNDGNSAAETVAALPYVTGSQFRLEGVLKDRPEDFQVDELPAYEPSGSGEHLFLKIRKRDISHDYLLGHVARSLGIRRDDIGAAGLKDRRAVTTQWLSVPCSAESHVAAIDTDNIQLLQATPHGNKLRSGHLKGNRFQILIRGTSSDQLSAAQQIVAELNRSGVPNYFGEQRFGIDGETRTLGLALLREQVDPKSLPAAKRKFLTRLALSAVQSELFNQILAGRLGNGWLGEVQPGDVMQVVASGGPFVVEDAEREQQRFDEREIVIAGPLFGPKMKSATGRPRELELQILQRADLREEIFRKHRKLTPGTRRPFVIWPQELTVAAAPDGILVTLTLPSGTYATIVLREFLKPPSVGEPSAQFLS